MFHITSTKTKLSDTVLCHKKDFLLKYSICAGVLAVLIVMLSKSNIRQIT